MAARILVVEDDGPLAENLCEILELSGYAPVAVSTAEAALDTVEAAPIDLIVADLRLPSMSGIDLLSRVRTRHRAIPAVLMSDWTIDDACSDRLSAVDFLARPFDIDILLSALARLLNSSNGDAPMTARTGRAQCGP